MATTNSITRVIEAVQTVIPRSPTDPRQSHQVSVANNLVPGLFKRCFHVVLYYKKVKEDSGWIVAGRIKASLGNALVEQPRLAGRLQRREDGDGKLYVVSNDSGVRLFEARIGMNLEEFLNLESRKEEEAQLVIWEDPDELNPETSPLLFVQVTNFRCGGYSIGFSCSILLADPLTMISFIKRWANINRSMISNGEFTEVPLFHSPNFRKPGYSPNTSKVSFLSKNNSQSLIFKLASENQSFLLNYDIQKRIATLCMEEAERITGMKIPSTFCLYVKQAFGDIKVEKLSRDDIGTEPTSALVCASWDDFGVDDITIQEGNNPAGVSHWISDEEEGLVMVILPSDEGILGMKIIVAIHNDKAI